jgi:hypothetical protein
VDPIEYRRAHRAALEAVAAVSLAIAACREPLQDGRAVTVSRESALRLAVDQASEAFEELRREVRR